jgi:hypothetical protein
MSTTKKSPVWPPFPGCGYEGAYQPRLADEAVAEKQKLAAAKKGRASARRDGQATGAGWGKGTLAGLSRKSDEAIARTKIARQKHGR